MVKFPLPGWESLPYIIGKTHVKLCPLEMAGIVLVQASENKRKQISFFNNRPTVQLWRAVTSETGHATGMLKTGHAIVYFISS